MKIKTEKPLKKVKALKQQIEIDEQLLNLQYVFKNQKIV